MYAGRVQLIVHEFRRYVAVPGRRDLLRERFREGTLGLFASHGIRPIEMWETAIGSVDSLQYVLEWTSIAERETAWAEFQRDPDWLALKHRTESDGPLIARLSNEIWRPILGELSRAKEDDR
jgi:hypothetical protein